MNIKIIALGKLKEKFLKEGICEFQKRLTPYTNLEIIELQPIEIKDEHLVEKILDEEADKILAFIKPQSYVISLEIKGKQVTSEEFAEKISNVMNDGISEIIFVIGSSCGLSAKISKRADYRLSFKISKRADYRLSLSKMTFLHQFTRLILIEQIYRAFKIMKGETYHK